MRQVSLNRQAKMRRAGPGRQAFVKAAVTCMCCIYSPADQCHEMARGIHRDKALEDRRSWLAVCWSCNCFELTDAKKWSLPKQLALKWIYDREYFDLEGFNVLRGRQPGAISMCEVVLHICRLLDGSESNAR